MTWPDTGTGIRSTIGTVTKSRGIRYRDPVAKFNALLGPSDPESGCRIWGGYIDDGGYGIIWAYGKHWKVHRFAWTIQVGPIPDGLTIDHVKDRGCRSRACAEIAHLEPVTGVINTLRGDSPHARSARIEACPQGHEYTETNTYMNQGKRRCHTCLQAERRAAREQINARRKAWRQQRREAGLPVT